MRRVILLLLIAMFCGGTAFAFEQSVTAGSDAQKVDNLTNFVLRPKYEIKTDAPVAKTEPITSEVKSEETKEVKAKEEEKKEPVSESTEIVKPVTLTPVHDVEKSVTQQVKEENVAEEQSAVEEKPVTEEDFKSAKEETVVSEEVKEISEQNDTEKVEQAEEIKSSNTESRSSAEVSDTDKSEVNVKEEKALKPSYAKELEPAVQEEEQFTPQNIETENSDENEEDVIQLDFPKENMIKLKTQPIKVVPPNIEIDKNKNINITPLQFQTYEIKDEYIKNVTDKKSLNTKYDIEDKNVAPEGQYIPFKTDIMQEEPTLKNEVPPTNTSSGQLVKVSWNL